MAKNTAAQAVAEQILEMIRRSVIKPGDQLPPEKDLTERFGVGRSTVREALQILSTLNVVQATTGHGTFVTQPKAANILRADIIGFLIGNAMALDLLEAREMIEPTLVRLACLRGTDQDFDSIEHLLDEHEAALRKGQSVNEYAARFHLLLAEAAHNSVASIFISSILQLLMSRGRNLENMPEYLKRELSEHRKLLRLVRMRDPAKASEFLVKHIVDSATTYARAEGNCGQAKRSPSNKELINSESARVGKKVPASRGKVRLSRRGYMQGSGNP